jgi:hypothetical protein
MSILDNATGSGDFAPDFKSLRFEVTIGGVTSVRLIGVREQTGGGYAVEGVTHVYDASGSGEPANITSGRKKPNEVTLKLDPLTYTNVWVPFVVGRRFDFKVTTVGAASIASTSDVYEGCTDGGMEPENANDGTPIARTVKFMATRFIPAGSSPMTAF